MNDGGKPQVPGARFRLNQPPVVAEAIDGEVMIINLDSGAYYSVSGAGATVWKRLVEGETTAALVADALSRFDVDGATLAGDVDRFVADLVTEGVLVPIDDASDAQREQRTDSRGAARLPKATYDGLRFERYDDMDTLSAAIARAQRARSDAWFRPVLARDARPAEAARPAARDRRPLRELATRSRGRRALRLGSLTSWRRTCFARRGAATRAMRASRLPRRPAAAPRRHRNACMASRRRGRRC